MDTSQRPHPHKGELRASRVLDPNAQRDAVKNRLKVLREPLWELQPTETLKAYASFRVYRDLGASRTQIRAAEVLGLANPRNPQYLVDMSSKYRWVERVRAYDAYLDTMMLGAQEQAMRDAARRWVARGEEIREMEYSIAMGLAAKVAQMLRYPISQVTRSKHLRDGKTILLTIIEPARWDWKSAADILARVGYQARMSADMVTDGARAPSPDQTDRGVADIDAWLAEIGVTAEQDAGPGE